MKKARLGLPLVLLGLGAASAAHADVVYGDDLIVQGSECIGFDCVNGESFGFDTLRLKENNLRIKFEDTSSSTSFPSNDWQLTANDSASGGLNKFSIEDITGARVPFTVEAGASTNALYIDSTSRIGLRTSTPVLDLHITTSNTPGLRLEQTSASGWAPQTWDIAGNEANFFIRDVTGGSRLPFRIRPGAPTSSIDVSASGDVGVGTSSPQQPLHIARTTDDATLRLEHKLASDSYSWDLAVTSDGSTANSDSFTLHRRSSVGGLASDAPMLVLKSDGTLELPGNLDLYGTLRARGGVTYTSDVAAKHAVVPVDGSELLTKVAALPVSRWRYREDASGSEHVGPMAQDFHAAFGLGADETQISISDLAGIALAGVKALTEENQRQAAEIERLKGVLERRTADVQSLQQRLNSIEGVVQRLALDQLARDQVADAAP